MKEKKLPKKLRRSEAYHDDPATAVQWWDNGFRPIPAEELRPDDLVKYRDTDIFRFTPTGPFRVGRVEWVKITYAGVEVMHNGCASNDPTICDELDEVWAKREWDQA